MQNSELYRRGFVVPLNQAAEQAILNNNVDECTAVDYYELPNDELFEELWTKGLFEKINGKLRTMIDDYEEQRIESKHIVALREIVSQFEKTTEISFSEKKATSELIRLCGVALEKDSSLFIIL